MIFAPKRELLRILRMEWCSWLMLPLLGVTILAAQWRSLLVGGTNRNAVFLLLVFVPAARILYRVYATSYLLTDDSLFVHVGGLKWKVPLEFIESARRCVSPGDALVWGRESLSVRYRCRPQKSEEVYIAPQNGKEFLSQLREHAPWLDLDGGDLVRREATPEILPRQERVASHVDSGALSPTNLTRIFPPRRDFDYVAEVAYVPVLFAVGFFWMFANRSPPEIDLMLMLLGGYVIYLTVTNSARLVFARYELADEGLIVRFGFSRDVIPYGQIREVYPETFSRQRTQAAEPVSNFCWTWSPLRIDARTEAGSSLKSVRIAPRYREQFLTELQALCPGAERRGDVVYVGHADPEDAAPGSGGPGVSRGTIEVS